MVRASEIKVFISSREGTCGDCGAPLTRSRHTETEYDRLLSQGIDRHQARSRVAGVVDVVVRRWLG
jgi:hypothetical protein